MSRVAVVCMVVVLVPALAMADDAQDRLKHASRSFDYSEYDVARVLVEELLNNNELGKEADLVEANRIAGLCWFYGRAPDKEAKARAYFLNLLHLNPDYEMDPFFTLPTAVRLFEDLKKENQADLDRRRAERREEEERKRQEQAKPPPPKVEYVHRDVEHHDKLLAFMPLGIGQFQNGDTGLGVTLGAIQAVSGATSLGCFIGVAVLNNQYHDQLPRDAYQTSTALNATKWVAGGVFFATWIYGAIQAVSGFQPQVELPIQGKPGGERSEKTGTPSVTPFIAPTAGGGVVGIDLGL